MPALSEDHLRMLSEQGIELDAAERRGIYTASSLDELPEGFRNYGSGILPALVFPWTEPDGNVRYQVKVPEGFSFTNGEAPKYLWPKGGAAQLGVIREEETDDKIIIAEGTKQSIVAGEYAPGGYSVYGIAGCQMWMSKGNPTPHLSVADGKNVFIILDADASTNPDVYEAGVKLQEALFVEGALDVRFVRVPGGGKAALDDFLGKRNPGDRKKYMKRLLGNSSTKPADRKPAKKRKSNQSSVEIPRTRSSDRPEVVFHGDNIDFAVDIIDKMRDKYDGTRLFHFGGKLSERTPEGMNELDKDSVKWVIEESCRPMSVDRNGDTVPHSHYGNTISGMVLARPGYFSHLTKLSSSPFVREDGSICQTSGYDKDSETYLDLPEELKNVSVPEKPTKKEVNEAVSLLTEDLLEGFPFVTQADRANAIGLLLTPFIRGFVPTTPLAVVDGRQPGVGKNLFADVVSLVVLGKQMELLTYTNDPEEMRKSLTSAFRSGQEFFCFDEAHYLSGKYLAQALTAATWRDRTLGKSESVGYPNKVTWLSLGNQVQIGGDLGRRVYRINIGFDGENPENRPREYFKHPYLKEWIEENRAELVQACLTIIRYWFSKGQPEHDLPFVMGSFEKWQKIISGILGEAGVEDFLGNVTEWRSESDFSRQHWLQHFVWLRETFGDAEFTCGEVKSKLASDPKDAETPPELEDTSAKNYTRELGRAYAKKANQVIEGHKLVRSSVGHRKTQKWMIIEEGGGFRYNKPEKKDPEPDVDFLTPPPEEFFESFFESNQQRKADDRMLVFDIETADADDLFSYEKGKFAILSGYNDVITTDHRELVEEIEKSDTVVGHNIVDFDLVALARHYGLDYSSAVEKAKDTLMMAKQIDPPSAQGMPKGYYSLDQVAKRLGVPHKTDDIKRLKKKYGGFDKIPSDDPELREYLKGDLGSSKAVYYALDNKLSKEDREYVERETKVSGRLNRSRLNGFRVDTDLLNRRLEEQKERKEAAFHRLGTEFGVPVESKSPLATRKGKDALIEALKGFGVYHYPKTEKTGDISTNKDKMKELVDFYSDPEKLRKFNIRPESVDVEGLKDLADLVVSVTSERTVYQTIDTYRVGDRIYPKVVPEQASGRWSVTKPGLTVLGKRGGKYVEREVLLPEEGEVILAVDLDQVDARAVAGHCQDPSYMALFEPGKDLHSEIAEMVFGRSDGEWRDRAKALGHGFNYGMGPKGASINEGIPLDIATTFHQNMSERFPILDDWKQVVRAAASNGELLDNGFGRKMRCDPERAYTQAPGLVGQGTTRDIMAEWILRLPEEIVPCLRTVVHDEIIFSVPEAEWESYRDAILDAARMDFRGVPITAGCSKPGKSWGEVYRK
jgi:DNA polymerase-1